MRGPLNAIHVHPYGPHIVVGGLGGHIDSLNPACGRKTYLFKELDIGTIIRNPKKVGLFGYRCTLSSPSEAPSPARSRAKAQRVLGTVMGDTSPNHNRNS